MVLNGSYMILNGSYVVLNGVIYAIERGNSVQLNGAILCNYTFLVQLHGVVICNYTG
jgi:hypothetical protein